MLFRKTNSYKVFAALIFSVNKRIEKRKTIILIFSHDMRIYSPLMTVDLSSKTRVSLFSIILDKEFNECFL